MNKHTSKKTNLEEQKITPTMTKNKKRVNFSIKTASMSGDSRKYFQIYFLISITSVMRKEGKRME